MRKERAIRLNDEKNIYGDVFFWGGGGFGPSSVPVSIPSLRFKSKLSRSKELLSPVK